MTHSNMDIKIDDLSDPKIVLFLHEHMNDMLSVSPPESTHALDLDGLKQGDVTFWSAWDKDALLACGALKRLNAQHGEIKSMRTNQAFRGRGTASALLTFILEYAQKNNFQRLSLETGSMDFFAPARALYEKFGFEYCPPFANYVEDPNSVFMTKCLDRHSRR